MISPATYSIKELIEALPDRSSKEYALNNHALLIKTKRWEFITHLEWHIRPWWKEGTTYFKVDQSYPWNITVSIK